jgi:hypothetical protein
VWSDSSPSCLKAEVRNYPPLYSLQKGERHRRWPAARGTPATGEIGAAKSSMRKVILAIFIVLIMGATVAPAEASKGLCTRAYSVRAAVVKKHGTRAPGRNICRYGVQSRFNKHWTKKPTNAQKAAYLRALKDILHPPIYLSAVGTPEREPAGTLSPRGSLPYCTWGPESGGNYHGPNNPSSGASGKYQITPGTWAAYGGTKYAGQARDATPAQQDEIAAKIASQGGLSNWVNC